MTKYLTQFKEKTETSMVAKIAYIALGKLLQLITVLFAVSFLTFLLTRVAPGEPGLAMYKAAGIHPTDEMLALTREQLGLNKPFFVQYFTWLGNCLQGDLGTSFSKHEEVTTLIATNLSSTFTLAITTLVVTLVIAMPLGILAAVKSNKLTDYIIRFASFVAGSTPNFLAALVLTFVLCYTYRLFPVVNKPGTIEALILPVTSLAIPMVANYIRQIRTCYLEELSQEYVYGARARGMSETRILFVHVMRNTLLPLITLVALSFGSLLGGAAIVEFIFSYPGLGSLIVHGVAYRDYPLIQGFVLWVAMCYTLINIGTDLLYKVFDPRLRKI